ncbi:MAG TPA: ABC transporter permease [Candidatus Blautia stercoravium]|nr:ABC transporter permease [Candidatus Blautia stercoravium]
MRNNNKKVIQKLSIRTMKQSRMRNLFAIAAICLTTLLFTAVFSMGFGMMQMLQEQTMQEVGGRFHAGLKGVTMEQYEKISQSSQVASSSWNILLGMADNLKKRQGEIRLAGSKEELEGAFIKIKEGAYPEKEDEILMDTITLKELKIPARVGEKVTLEYTFMGKNLKQEFILSGWYEGSEISHASELYISKAYWEKVKGNYTEKDFLEQYEKTGDLQGLVNGNLYFHNARNIEDKVVRAIKEAGYTPEDESKMSSTDTISYGVNWAYMTSRTENLDMESVVLFAAVFCLILVTGYLIIYNIFQLSILREIRFYGLLKTIGTTKKQLQKLVYRQVWKLCGVGLPLGAVMGYFLGQLLLPMLARISTYTGSGGFYFNVWILVFGCAFSLLTVLVSCRKPVRIAGNVSPVEAVRYTEGGLKRKRIKKSKKGAKIARMAFSNLGRNKKKTVLVITSISLSVILLELVMTAVGSFRIEQYLEERIAGDYMIGNTNWTSASPREIDFQIDEAYVQGADNQQGITSTSELWHLDSEHILSEKGQEEFRKLDKAGKIKTGVAYRSREEDKEKMGRGEMALNEDRYGYSDSMLKNLKAVKGTIDLKKFKSGKYVILQENICTDNAEKGDSFYQPGDKIVLQTPTSLTEQKVEYDENGEALGAGLTNLEQKEYEVMAVVEALPGNMDLHMYSINAITTILPLEEMKKCPTAVMFAKSYTVEPEYAEAFDGYLKYYTEEENVSMGYLSKESVKADFSGMIDGVSAVGYGLCAVIAIIGILNFGNSMLTGILSRRQELAVMQSIGMTKEQVQKMLLWESGYYLIISGVISVTAGSVIAYFVVSALNNVIMCFAYRYTAVPFLIMLPMFALMAGGISLAAYRQTQKKSVVERMRETE